MHRSIYAYYKELSHLRKLHGELSKGLLNANYNKDYAAAEVITEQIRLVQEQIEYVKSRFNIAKKSGMV
jgi:hypothetical protein